jgi:hypothetical protein
VMGELVPLVCQLLVRISSPSHLVRCAASNRCVPVSH